MLKLEHFQKLVDLRKTADLNEVETDPVCNAFYFCKDCPITVEKCYDVVELDAQALMDSVLGQRVEDLKVIINDLHNNFPDAFPHGVEAGEVCFRDGCDGEIMEYEKDGCSCHINPPCSACVANRAYCPKCDWYGSDE